MHLNKNFSILFATLITIFTLGCGNAGFAILNGEKMPENEPELDRASQVQLTFDSLRQDGMRLYFGEEMLADLSQTTPVTSSYGSVTQGTTLNPLRFNDFSFIVYGNDGVFAAECEPSTVDETFGPTHPLCQTVGTENYDRMVICFANEAGVDIMAAQEWNGSEMAFQPGHGMICYNDGVKMKSQNIFTY